MQRPKSRISGTGSCLPDRIVTNLDLANCLNVEPEWIAERSGIQERRWVTGTTTTSDLAATAADRALEAAGLRPDQVDMLVLATISPDHDFPGTACFTQAKLGISDIPALDIRQQCSGFIYALSTADAFIRTGQADRVLVIGAEIHSKGLDLSPNGKEISILFGDGAGAVVLERTDDDSTEAPQVYSTHLHADGKHAKTLWAEAPSQAFAGHRISHADLDAGRHFPQMSGKSVFLHAVRRMPESIEEALAQNDRKLEEVDLFLFHQANLRINEAVARRMNIPAEKVFNTIEKLGNTTAATIPIGMDMAIQGGSLTPGMLVACSAFGSGFTWGSALLRF